MLLRNVPEKINIDGTSLSIAKKDVFLLKDENKFLATMQAIRQLAQTIKDVITPALSQAILITDKIIVDAELLDWIHNLPDNTVVIPLSHEILSKGRDNVLVSWNGLCQMQGAEFAIKHLDDGYSYETKNWSGYVTNSIQLLYGNLMLGDKIIIQYCPNPILTPTKVAH